MPIDRTAVVMVSVSDRVDKLNLFLTTLAEHEPGRDIFIHLQDPDRRASEVVIPPSVKAHLHVTPRPLGCHAARVVALREMASLGYSAYVNVDDDVELTPHTHWQPAIDYAQSRPDVGFVLTNWVRHRNALTKNVPLMADEFLPQVMVYNGGGMAYTDDVADLMRELPVTDARYDDLWPLTSYLAGRRNYRYRGSLSVHNIMTRGGMNSYMRREPRPLLCWDWINYRAILGAKVGSDYAIPQDSDLRPVARTAHRQARAARGWS